MSQYRVVKHNPPVPNEPEEYTVYMYGYDKQLMYYFLSIVDSNVPGVFDPNSGEDTVELVGMLSPLYGDKTNLHTKMTEHGIWHMIPAEHQTAILMDLPF